MVSMNSVVWEIRRGLKNQMEALRIKDENLAYGPHTEEVRKVREMVSDHYDTLQGERDRLKSYMTQDDG